MSTVSYKNLPLLAMCLFLVHCSEVKFKSIPFDQTTSVSELPGDLIQEKFTQKTEGAKLDILFVVDNSPSMSEEQTKLGKRLSSFTDQLGDVDWNIAVTNTDVTNGAYGMKGHLFKFSGGSEKSLNKNSPNFKERFLNTVVLKDAADCVGECPSVTEEPLTAIIMALNLASTTNSTFFRDDAEFVTIIISDEDEMSVGPIEATKPRMVTHTFESLFPNKAMSAYGIIIEPGDVDCKWFQGIDGSYGTHVAELARITHGTTSSICEKDYSAGLAEIGQKAKKLFNTYTLSKVPKAGTVKIEFQPQHTTEFHVEHNKVILNDPPPDGTAIFIRYQETDEVIDPIAE